MAESLDRYIEYAPSIHFIHLSLACSLHILRLTNIAERRGESGEKVGKRGEKGGEKGGVADVESRLSVS